MSRWPFERRLRPGQVTSDSEADIREEIELYLELRARELEEEEGLEPNEARRVARERFGRPERVEDELRRQAQRRRTREGMSVMIGGLRQDLGFAARTLRRSPGFTLVAVLTLGLALGGNTAIFSVVDAALLQAMPFEDHEQLVFVNGVHNRDGEVAVRGASYPEFRDWRERVRTMDGMSAVATLSVALTGDGTAERVPVEVVSEDYFRLFGVQASLGRLFEPGEFGAEGPRQVAIISDALFERRFQRDPSVLGSTLLVNEVPLTVVGVAPSGFAGIGLSTELFVPEPMISLAFPAELLESRGSRFLTVVGRLGGGVSLAAAQDEVEMVGLALQDEYPNAHEDRSAHLQGFRDGYLGTTGDLLWVFLGAGGVLLLIASANVANLLLVRSRGRTKEVVLRRALGAGGKRIAGQLLTESLVLAVLGGLVGLGLAVVALASLGPLIPAGVLPGYVEPEVSAGAFLVSMLSLAVVGVGIGLVPAVVSARVDIASRLREGSKSASGGGLKRIRPQHLFVVAQVSLALALMVGAGLLTRSFQAQLAVDTGSDHEGVAAMSLQLPRTSYDTGEAIQAFDRELERRLGALPGVTSVSISTDLPFRNGSSGAFIYREGDGPDDRIRYHRHAVSPGFFETIGVEVLRGRAIDDGDVDGSAPVAVITETMEQRVYPGEGAVGKTMYLRSDGTRPVQIVGVVKDVRFRDVTTSLLADANSPDVLFPIRQQPSLRLEAAVRTTDLSAVLPLMRQAVVELDPNLPVSRLEPLADAWQAQTAMPRFAAFLMTLFSTLAAVVACVGIYGVLAFTVGQRGREIAIRRAVGATGASVARGVVGDGIKLSVAGMAVGAAVAAFGSSVLEAFLFDVGRTDPTTFVSMATAMVLVSLVAAIVPALRAMRRDPADALKTE